MAPANGSAKSRKSGAANRQAPKPVVPAIPLPHVKRQAAAAAVAAVASPASSSAAADSELVKVNGTDESDAAVKDQAAPQEEPELPTANATQSGQPSVAGGDATGSSDMSSHPPAPSRPGPEDIDSVAATPTVANTIAAVPEEKVPVVSHHTDPLESDPSDYHPTVTAMQPEPRQQPILAEHHFAKDRKPRPPPSISPTRYHMPPTFHPSGRPMVMMGNGDIPPGSRYARQNGPAHHHQTHQSNGSVHFGMHRGSASSSPAPLHNSALDPPPGIPPPEMRAMYMQPPGGAFPPMMPYGGEMMPVSSFDQYGRPAMAYPPMDSYANFGNGFPPSTPHSFPDSLSPGNPDEKNVYPQYGAGPARNGVAGPREDSQSQNSQNRIYNGFQEPARMMQGPVMAPDMPREDDADDLVRYFQGQFGDPDLADSTLVLRYLDDRAPPVRIPGHRIIFSRSPALLEQIKALQLQPVPLDRSMQTILLETNSKWVRSDAFYMAAQRLYGSQLLRIPPPAAMETGDLAQAGSFMDRFNFALSYAAAGHLLEWLSVVQRGCDIATQHLDWQTLEIALDFALEEYRDDGTQETYKYGEGSSILLNGIANFIIRNIPPNFSLDVSVIEPAQYARLLSHTLPPRSQPPAPPTIARGSSVQLGKGGRRTSKFTNIQFGDLLLSEGGSEAECTPVAQHAQVVFCAVLSRILLNLPFSQLKMILESNCSGDVHGWATAESRYRVVKDAVEEREARRHRALDAVLAGRVHNSEAIRGSLRSPRPQFIAGWTALGWHEEILPYGNADTPSLSRTWLPLRDTENNSSVAEYP